MEDHIVKHLLKKNKGMTQSEAKEKAKKIWDAYCEVHKERNIKRQIEFKKEWDRALQKENDAIAFEYLSGDELIEYFNSSDSDD